MCIYRAFLYIAYSILLQACIAPSTSSSVGTSGSTIPITVMAEDCPYTDDELLEYHYNWSLQWEDLGHYPPTENIEIHCSSLIGGGIYAGLTHSPTSVEIATDFGDGRARPLTGTALRHELCHAYLWQVYGDPEHDHKGNWPSLIQ